jgi:hypothetical protein
MAEASFLTANPFAMAGVGRGAVIPQQKADESRPVREEAAGESPVAVSKRPERSPIHSPNQRNHYNPPLLMRSQNLKTFCNDKKEQKTLIKKINDPVTSFTSTLFLFIYMGFLMFNCQSTSAGHLKY